MKTLKAPTSSIQNPGSKMLTISSEYEGSQETPMRAKVRDSSANRGLDCEDDDTDNEEEFLKSNQSSQQSEANFIRLREKR